MIIVAAFVAAEFGLLDAPEGQLTEQACMIYNAPEYVGVGHATSPFGYIMITLIPGQ